MTCVSNLFQVFHFISVKKWPHQPIHTPTRDCCIKKRRLSSLSLRADITDHLKFLKKLPKTIHSCRAPSLAQAETTGRSICVWCHSRQSRRGETTHIWQSRPVCESQRTQWHGEQTVPSAQHWHWTPHASAVSPLAVNTGPLWATHSDTGQESGQGNVSLAVWLTHTHIHTHIHTHALAPTSLRDLTYTPRPENSFKACKGSAFHCNLWLWGQLCPSVLPWASENRHGQPHSLGCYF